jgi:small-conductance mechanosensitive channel
MIVESDGTIAGALGIFGLALGFATPDTVENYIASILLSLRQPFSPEDHVIVDGWEGKLVRLTPRATILMSLDGNHIRIPNSTVFKSVIQNFTANPLRRFDFSVGVDTAVDLDWARSIALQTLNGMKGVLDDPAPQCLVQKLGDSNVNLLLLASVDQHQSKFGKTRSEALRQIKEAYDDTGIVMPEPIYIVK